MDAKTRTFTPEQQADMYEALRLLVQNKDAGLKLSAWEWNKARAALAKVKGQQADPRQAPGSHGYNAPRAGEPCTYCGHGEAAEQHAFRSDLPALAKVEG